MSAGIFRKVSLDRLSSPEQLDQLLVVTRPQSWLALAGVCALVAGGVVWGMKGSVPTKVMGQGVILRAQGVFNVVTPGAGRVLGVNVAVNDQVQAQQVVATIGQPEMGERLRSTREQLAAARDESAKLAAARNRGTQLQLESLARQKQNLDREIANAEREKKLAAEQIPVDEQLQAKGIITKQAVLAGRQRVVALEEKIAGLHAQITQISASEMQLRNQETQAALESNSRATELERTIRYLETQLAESSRVVSPYSGKVLEIQASKGSLVSVGAPILSIEPSVKRLEAVVYISSAEAKEIRPGMDVEVSPTTVKREEYGYMRGKVSYVAEFPVTPASLMRTFENDALVRTMSGAGPVNELRIELAEDPTTASGFRWSSPGGPPNRISSGTMCMVQVITREQRPASLVIPMLKKKLGLS